MSKLGDGIYSLNKLRISSYSQHCFVVIDEIVPLDLNFRHSGAWLPLGIIRFIVVIIFVIVIT
jgi:hypothetical protein